ncbi:hypothetical protein J7M00_06010 [bacterium]|nr:hypothetical protein [bacterium]
MRKFWLLFAFIAVFGLVFAAGDGSGGADVPESPEYSASSDDGGGGPDEPFEAMADTTADIYIYVTLRQPPGPPPPNFYIFDENCGTGSENVYFKSDLGPGERSDCDFYLVYRAPWALFEWSDIRMFSSSDTAQMIDPVENPVTHADAGMYRWGWKESPSPGEDSVWVGPPYTYDFFDDSLLSASDSRGVCDPDTNWFYTAVAVDSSESGGNLLYSPYPARPVGEVDQLLGGSSAGKKNLVSYAVEDEFVSSNGDTAKYFAQLIDSCVSLWEWDAINQRWNMISRKIGSVWLNIGGSTVRTGMTYLAYLSDGISDSDTFMLSLYAPGYVPYDTSLHFTKPASWNEGKNFFTMPYQEYNILISVNGYPLEAKYLGMDIDGIAGIEPVSIWEWNPFSQRYDMVARKIGTLWLTVGGAHVYPGLPYMVIINGDGGDWPPSGS